MTLDVAPCGFCGGYTDIIPLSDAASFVDFSTDGLWTTAGARSGGNQGRLLKLCDREDTGLTSRRACVKILVS